MASQLHTYSSLAFDSVREAWRWTNRTLFRQFTFGKWFVWGFAAWLAVLGRGGPGLNVPLPGKVRRTMGSSRDVREALRPIINWIYANPIQVIGIIGVMVIVGLALGLLLLWLGSRGKFVFLANVACNHSEIRRPWCEFRSEGTSLFLWRLCFGLAVLLVFLVVCSAGSVLLYILRANTPAIVAVAVSFGLTVFLLSLVVTVIGTFLEDFIVPLMYRYRLSAMAAWGYFLQLFRQHVTGFLVYVLCRWTLRVGAFMLVWAVVLATCCVAGIVFAIPYIGTVATLPIPVFFRSYSLCFLARFHADYRMIQDVPETEAPGPDGPSSQVEPAPEQ